MKKERNWEKKKKGKKKIDRWGYTRASFFTQSILLEKFR
jgi:hypothetical protein